MIPLEPLGTGIILPAAVAGYELPLPRGDPDRLEGLPPWADEVACRRELVFLGTAYARPGLPSAFLLWENRIREPPSEEGTRRWP